jgi:hypothetical protein
MSYAAAALSTIPTPSKESLKLTPQEVCNIIMHARAEGLPWESRTMRVMAAMLEEAMGPFPSPTKCLRMHNLLGYSVASYVENAIKKYLPVVSAVKPRATDVLGDGNCLDNSTLVDLFGHWKDAFSWRVRKGLHFLQNVTEYQSQLNQEGEFLEGSSLSEFIRVYFENKEYQSPFHDLPAAQLLKRPICIWLPTSEVYFVFQ